MTEAKKEALQKECYELEKYNCEPITFYMAGYEKGLSENKKVLKNREVFIDWMNENYPEIVKKYLGMNDNE